MKLSEIKFKQAKSIDPESISAEFIDKYDTSDSEIEKDETLAREHYVQVGRGNLRVKANPEQDSVKYRGSKTSRSQLYEDDSEESEMSSAEKEASDDSENEDGSFDHEENVENRMTASTGFHVGEIGSDDVSEDVSGDDEEDASEDEEKISTGSDDEEDEDQDAIQREMAKMNTEQVEMEPSVSDQVQNDAEKGKHVKNQMALYDHFLDSRIRLQRVVKNANIMPDHSQYDLFKSELVDNYGDEALTGIWEASSEIQGFLGELMGMRRDLLSNNDLIPSSLKQKVEHLPNSKKRKFQAETFDEDVHELVQESWDDLNTFDSAFKDYRDQTIDKWNSKVQVSTTNIKFKAISTTTINQINQVLQDKERLLKRCRLKRCDYKFICPNDQTSGEYDSELFDDVDFYQMLLKDFIDSRVGSGGDDPISLGLKMVQLKQLQEQQKKHRRKNIDTKASKGRKLRYHVQEKLVNFMAPEPRGTWHDEMREQLFMGLFGSRIASKDKDNKESQLEISMKTDSSTGNLQAADGFRILVG